VGQSLLWDMHDLDSPGAPEKELFLQIKIAKNMLLKICCIPVGHGAENVSWILFCTVWRAVLWIALSGNVVCTLG
jgi:hypothetical protein